MSSVAGITGFNFSNDLVTQQKGAAETTGSVATNNAETSGSVASAAGASLFDFGSNESKKMDSKLLFANNQNAETSGSVASAASSDVVGTSLGISSGTSSGSGSSGGGSGFAMVA